jgi:hypothetical protein
MELSRTRPVNIFCEPPRYGRLSPSQRSGAAARLGPGALWEEVGRRHVIADLGASDSAGQSRAAYRNRTERYFSACK